MEGPSRLLDPLETTSRNQLYEGPSRSPFFLKEVYKENSCDSPSKLLLSRTDLQAPALRKFLEETLSSK